MSALVVASALLALPLGEMAVILSNRYVEGGRVTPWTVPATGASVAALFALQVERGGWPTRRWLAALVVAGCAATHVGLALLGADDHGPAWLGLAAPAVALLWGGAAYVDWRDGERGGLATAVIGCTAAWLVVGVGSAILWYLRHHPMRLL